MLNITGSSLKAGEHLFINEIAALFEPWGWTLMSGRVYGYLLLNRGTVSVNQIAADLGTSKVAAWKAARSLEEFGHVRRYGDPGSKRALYGPTDNFDAPILRQCVLLGSLGKLLQNSASTITTGDVSSRLKEMARFYFSMRKAMESAIEELNVARSRAR